MTASASAASTTSSGAWRVHVRRETFGTTDLILVVGTPLSDVTRERREAVEAMLVGIMYDEPDDKIILTNHSRPIGTLTAIDPATGDIVATVNLEDTAREGAAADGNGHIFVNNESKNTIQVIDVKTWKATASWPLAPCDGPTGLAYDKASNRIFSGCSKTSVVVEASTGKVVASIANGTRVDAFGMGSVEEADFHSQWRRRQRHRRPPGFTGQLPRRGDGRDVRRRKDHRRRSRDPQRVSLPARAGPRPGASGRRGESRTRRPWTRSAGSDCRGVVHGHQVLTTRADRRDGVEPSPVLEDGFRPFLYSYRNACSGLTCAARSAGT
jgi:hypothetical protein